MIFKNKFKYIKIVINLHLLKSKRFKMFKKLGAKHSLESESVIPELSAEQPELPLLTTKH